jgi:HK97 gp10 family phage protein
MATGARIEVKGLKEFQKALRDMDSDLPKQLRIALNQASQLVVDKAKTDIPTRSGAARSSLKARSGQREARVAAGGRKAPYYPWLDFGGRVGRNRSVHRAYYKEGRYIYPALRQNREEIITVMTTAVADLARRAGLDVT